MLCNLQIAFLLLVVVITCYAQVGSDHQSVVQSGVKVVYSKGAPSLGYTLADMLLTIPTEDELPGYTVVMRERRREDEGILPGADPTGHTSSGWGRKRGFLVAGYPFPMRKRTGPVR
ncbi:hypothetical protein HRbin16_01061 [bacterium HR16]|nr:hypothetical protein HRbin16_01061 [bacterium HR16]